MRLSQNELRDKALLVLEDAVQECRYRQPRRSFLLRFALAYLWSISPRGDRGCFDSFWAAMGEPKSPWNFSVANSCLDRSDVEMALTRRGDVPEQRWERWSREEGDGGGRKPEAGG